MVKVISPDETIQNYKTVGSCVTLKQKSSNFYISERAYKQNRGHNSQLFVEENSKAIQKEWEGLSPSEKNDWENLGVPVSQTGYSTFYNMKMKGTTNSVCGVAICGLNVCQKGL